MHLHLRSVICAALLLPIGGIAVAASLNARSHPVPPAAIVSLPTGLEQPVPGAAFVNGYNVADIGPCAFQRRYAEAAALLGPPVGPFTGRTQDFLFGRLICVPGAPSDSQVVFDDLGLQHLRLSGNTSQPGAEPHPAVRSHLLDALETGLEPSRIYGRVISPPRCDRAHHCTQYTDKQLLQFDDAPSAAVRWAPLGCLLNHACQQATSASAIQASAEGSRKLTVAVGAVVLVALLGTLVMLRRARSGGRSFGTTI